VARSGYGNGPFGAKLDSFADFLNFCVAPAVLLYHTYYQWEIITQLRGPDVLTSIAVTTVAGSLVVLGMLRLVRFEVLKGNERSDYFVGLPTPAASIPITLAAFLGWSPQVALPLTLAIALLMVSRVRFPKIRGALILPAVAGLLGTIFLRDQYGDLLPQLLFYGMVAYVVAGPLLVWWREESVEPEPPLAS